MLKIFKNISGLILAESLLSVAILATGAIVAGTLISMSVSSTLLSKSYLLAHNFGTEAVEGIRSINNANRLNKPNNPECWLTLDPAISAAECNLAGNQVVSGTNYRIVQKADGSWEMQTAAGNTDLDLDISEPKQYRIYLDSSLSYNKYVSLPNATANPTVDQAETPFYRSVKFVNVVPGESATMQLSIQWKDGRKTRSINRTVVLYNYL